MRPDVVLFLYLLSLLAALTGLWVLYAYRRRRFLSAPVEDRIFRCSKCSCVYTDDPDVDLSRCPQCGLMNGSFDFRS